MSVEAGLVGKEVPVTRTHRWSRTVFLFIKDVRTLLTSISWHLDDHSIAKLFIILPIQTC